MSSSIFFKLVNPEQANDASHFLVALPFNIKLHEAERPRVNLISDADIQWCHDHQNFSLIDDFKKNYGKGDFNVSAYLNEDLYLLDLNNPSDQDEGLTALFDVFMALKSKFEVYFYGGSCAFDGGHFYFNDHQVRQLTNDYQFLTGKELYFDKLNKLH